MILRWQRRLAGHVREAAREAFGADLGDVTFQYTPRPELGDLAVTAPFDLAKTLRRKPREIAAELASRLGQAPGVSRAEVAGGGYVNLFLDRGAYARELREGAPELPPRSGAPRVVVEHTSINPNKAAHVGHLRNAVLGDTFVRLLRFCGREVGVQNYVDDTGVQVADVVVGFQQLENKGLAEVEALWAAEEAQAMPGPGRPRRGFDYLCWDLYARVGDFYAADPARKALQAATLHAIEEGGDETARLAGFVAGRIVECHLRTMGRLGIHYELLAHESDILRLHFWERAFELLKERGAVRRETEGKAAGCWVLGMAGEGEAEGSDEDKIIVRSNGTVTYTGKDIAYQLWKLGWLDRDFRYRRQEAWPGGPSLWSTTSGEGEAGAPAFGHAGAVYNVIDVGQSYPQRVVKAGVGAVAGPEAAEGCHHLAYEKVVLSRETAADLGYDVDEGEGPVKVSGRKGLGVKGDDLIDALVAKARAEVDARDPGRDEAAREATARQVATGALRYFLLRFGRTRIITFDMKEALAFTGETGPYVQNGVVRARGILARLAEEGHDLAAVRGRALDLGALLSGRGEASPEEATEVWSLLLLMSRTDEVAEQAVRAEEPALLTRHAFAVAQAFHAYYQKPRFSVLHAASEDLRAFRVGVVDAFLAQMEALTALLGIPVPERM